MLKEFVEKIQDLAEAKIIKVKDKEYSTKSLHLIKDPMPSPIEIKSLSGVVDYLEENKDNLNLSSFFVVVESYRRVSVRSTLSLYDGQRREYIRAESLNKNERLVGWQSLESFIPSLLTLFVRTPALKNVVNIVGNLVDVSTVEYSDDGISQGVTIKKSITRNEKADLPSLVALSEYRTFIEVEQPESNYCLRIQKSKASKGFECSLLEGGGEQWKIVAVERIKEWLKKKLPAGIAIIG